MFGDVRVFIGSEVCCRLTGGGSTSTDMELRIACTVFSVYRNRVNLHTVREHRIGCFAHDKLPITQGGTWKLTALIVEIPYVLLCADAIALACMWSPARVLFLVIQHSGVKQHRIDKAALSSIMSIRRTCKKKV